MKRHLTNGLLALVVVLMHLGILLSPFGERLEMKAFDLWMELRGSRTPSSEVAIVTMDEVSYKNLSIPLSQAWPRSKHAELLQELNKQGAKKVIFDVLFIDPGSDAKTDQTLASAMSKVPTVLGTDSLFKDYSSSSGSYKLEELLLPYEPFQKASQKLGLVGFPEDHGYVRRFLVERTPQTKELPTLAEAAVDFDRNSVLRPSDRSLINYYGSAGTLQNLHYYQVLDPKFPLPDSTFKDKIVFVGLVLQTDVGPAQKDVFSTPYGRVFGTEIHATAALNLIHNDWITRTSKSLERFVLCLLTLALAFCIFTLRPMWAAILSAVFFVGWFSLGFITLTYDHFIPGMILSVFIGPLCLLMSVLYYYFVTRKAELKMLSAFELYVSPEMAKEVSINNKSLSLGGEKVWATAMFTDIQGFTSIAETMPAEQVSTMLNSYFTEVVDVVFKHQGTLIKFIGDAIFVIWGAPIKINNHAEMACQTALAIQEAVRRFNGLNRFPALNTRIGVHTGPMVVGNLGSSRRFDYTAIGDSVNLAARIEGINKFFGTDILISDETKREAGSSVKTIFIGAIKAAGKEESVDLHLLLSQPLKTESTETWLAAQELFKAKQWQEAQSKFAQVVGMESALKKAAEFYISLIKKFESETLPPMWQGEVSLEK